MQTVGRSRMFDWRLELVASDSDIATQLMGALDTNGVAYATESANTIVVQGEDAGDVVDLLGTEIYDNVIGPHCQLTCDDLDTEEETRRYMMAQNIPFVEHRFCGDLAFVINRQHDPDEWP